MYSHQQCDFHKYLINWANIMFILPLLLLLQLLLQLQLLQLQQQLLLQLLSTRLSNVTNVRITDSSSNTVKMSTAQLQSFRATNDGSENGQGTG